VVLDPEKGDILAAVASSPFDPSNYVGVAGIEPFNRALSGLYPPGSSMKVMTASTALELGEVKPDSRLTGPAEYKGVRNFESGAYPSLTFASALQNSVNTAFAQVAERIGAKRLTRFAELFGFNRSPSMSLQAATPSFPFPEDEGDLLWGAIGQAQTLATPLQMATIAATIANQGKRMEPRIVLSEGPTGERVLSRKTARIMTTLMESVVQGGTGVAAQISGLRVAGKTGTAEVDVGGERRNHAWFICFAPAGEAKVAVAVVAEYGGIGGQVAAPLARAILTRVLPLVQ
jgi:peptidoglycan glycosyltransferase